MSAQMGKRCQDKNSAYCDRKQEFAASDGAEHAGQRSKRKGASAPAGESAPILLQALAIRADQEAYTQGGGETETQRGVQTGASMALTVARAVVQIR